MPDLRITSIRPHSVTEGPGVRTTVFVQGCPIHCPGCHTRELWNPEGGHAIAPDDLVQILLHLRGKGNEGVSFVGGEPLAQPAALALVCSFLAELGIHTIVYTGYVYEDLLTRSRKESAIELLLAAADVLVDGPYVASLRDPQAAYRGSRNQRVIDLCTTRSSGALTLLDWDRGDMLTITPEGNVVVNFTHAMRPVAGALGQVRRGIECGALRETWRRR